MELNVSGNARLVVIVTFFVYTAGMLLIGWLAKKNMDRVSINKYIDEFYTGGRGMGALVVAMMIAAGLCSAGTFLGGPGLGYKLGATWVLVAGAQNFMTFIVLGEVVASVINGLAGLEQLSTSVFLTGFAGAPRRFGGAQRAKKVAPRVGLEPTTNRLTADCSTN